MLGFLMPEEQCTPPKKNNELNDGPYVLYKNDKIFIKYVNQDGYNKYIQSDSVLLSEKNNLVLDVATDEPGKKFAVKLKTTIENERSEYPDVNKFLAISDIEGNFAAFRKLLQANGVMDNFYNWTFGDGHLVLTGDFVDRGNQVTEVLWLIYSLEDKAKAEGGHVHFILGNHEIMNLSGDLRYLNKKYIENVTLLNEKFETLYGENSEIGKWLRSKNIIENIGGVLFTHGGISGDVNRLSFRINEINSQSRPFYADTTYNYPSPIDILFYEVGPFWYRGYYGGKSRATIGQIDSTLQKFNVNKISTGHTVVADTISVWYNGKIINTDVLHAAGRSEALLLENDKFYRVNTDGHRKWMMDR
jgi:hypothetical protein